MALPGAEETLEVSLKGLQLPSRGPPHTELLDLDPLPLAALGKPEYAALYTGRFSHFNPIQTQVFHTLYHTDDSVLLGAPTGSGKTISSELTMMRLWEGHPGDKVIYIAPLKALVRERMTDWGGARGLCRRLGKKLVELTGDYTPDLAALLSADVIIATPEKWDGISRNWQSRAYVKKVGLLIIDEIHLLGADRGPILEVIVSRMRYIAASMERPIRFVGLSTALANAHDLAEWLGTGSSGLFNFKPSVRPVPLEAHMQGYPGKFYCPRMASMNKPAYAAIQVHSPLKPVLVFVASRRQTRLTAMDLISLAAADEKPTQFVHMEPYELGEVLARVRDQSLRHCLQFGVGLHHAGLSEPDRQLVEGLFVSQKIQVLVATSTLAWGVNTPAHLVVIKGTEYYDAPSKRYVDFPITDVLQMMGRAGRPQYDTKGVAVIMVHEPKKAFYKRFLYEPFPVESSLQDQLPDHLNAEVVAGTISSRQDALDYLTWTYFYRRLQQNPAYYDLDDTSPEGMSAYLSNLVEEALGALEDSGCILLDALPNEDDDDAAENGGGAVAATPLGRVASFYYLQHTTAGLIAQQFRGKQLDHAEVLEVLCAASEYDELPVRHNEDVLNTQLARQVRLPVDTRRADDPHVKAHLLLQAHMSRLPPPISDYVTDTRGVLDNSVRLAQALVDVAAQGGCLGSALAVMELLQGLVQARWMDENSLTTLPHIDNSIASSLAAKGIHTLPQLLHALAQTSSSSRQQQHHHQQQQQEKMNRQDATGLLSNLLGGSGQANEVLAVADRLPIVDVSWRVAAAAAGSGSSWQQQQQQQEGQGEEQRWQLEVELVRRSAKYAGPSSSSSGTAAAAVAAGAAGGGAGGGKSAWGGQKAGGSSSSSGSSSGKAAHRVYAPLFPKVKEEGWWLVVGHAASLELLVLKRVNFGGKTTVKLNFPGYTSGGGTRIHTLHLYLISDCYLGLDQEYEIVVDAAAAAADARVDAAASSRWRGGGGSGGSSSLAATEEAAGGGHGDGGGVDAAVPGGGAAAAGGRRARRQQQMAARQQHAAEDATAAAAVADGDGDGWGDAAAAAGGAEWEDEPACG